MNPDKPRMLVNALRMLDSDDRGFEESELEPEFPDRLEGTQPERSAELGMFPARAPSMIDMMDVAQVPPPPGMVVDLVAD